MLDLFRRRGLTSVVYGVVIVATVLVFVIQFRPNAGQKTASLREACAARVRGYCIDPKDQRAAYRILIPRDSQGNLLTGRAKQMGLQRVALDGLIERELLAKEADRLGLKVTEDEITDQIYDGFIRVSVPSDNPQLAYQLRLNDGRVYAGFRDTKTKQFDVKVYERSVRMLVGRSPSEFRETQGREILAAKMRDVVRTPVRVSETEALGMYLEEKTSAAVDSITVKQNFVARYLPRPSSSDLDTWLKDDANSKLAHDQASAHKDDDAPKAGHLRHILIKMVKTASEDELASADARLSAAKARIEAGEPFATVARDVSEDRGSALHGGDVGDKTDGFVAPFKKAADALKPGETTATAIQTEFGLHLIMRDDPARPAPTDDVELRAAARSLWSKTKALETTSELAAKLAAALQAGTSTDDAIKALLASLAHPTSPPSLVVARLPTASAADETGDAGFADAAPAPPKVVRWEATKPVTPESDPERPQVATSTSFNRGGDPIAGLGPEGQKAVIAFAFGKSAKEGEVLTPPLHNDDGALVVRLKEHRAATKEEFDKDRDTYLQTLLAAKQAEALALHVKRLREAAKGEISIDESYLADAKPTGDAGALPPAEDEEEEP